MKSMMDIKKDLKDNGFSWTPSDRRILESVWSQMPTYLNEDETVLSVLWSSFKRYEDEMLGIVFITSNRMFTLEIPVNSPNPMIRYVPSDRYSVEKIQYQPQSHAEGLNYISLQNDSFGNGITFATKDRKAAEHFIETLSKNSNAIIEVLPESDDPLLAANEKEQVVDPEADKPEEPEEHKFEKKHEEEEVRDKEFWHKVDPFVEKPVKIKTVKAKKVKETSKTAGYGSKRNNFVWLLWFTFPLAVVVGVIVFIILI